jgi:hypothetical protein
MGVISIGKKWKREATPSCLVYERGNKRVEIGWSHISATAFAKWWKKKLIIGGLVLGVLGIVLAPLFLWIFYADILFTILSVVGFVLFVLGLILRPAQLVILMDGGDWIERRCRKSEAEETMDLIRQNSWPSKGSKS